MDIFISGLSLFLISLGLHILIWKLKIPANPVKVLILIFFGIFAGYIIMINANTSSGTMDFVFHKLSGIQMIHLIIFYSTLTVTYLLIYLALIEDGPSLFTIISLTRSLNHGLTRDELMMMITDDYFILPRIKFLIDEKMIHLMNDKYSITEQGKKFLSTYLFIQRLMRWQDKAG